MEVIRFLINKIIDILNLNLDIFGYDICLMNIILFIVLGSVLLSFLYAFFDWGGNYGGIIKRTYTHSIYNYIATLLSWIKGNI